MATMHLKQTTTLTPERFIAGLTDFGPDRSKLFANSADGYLEVHDQGLDHADVTEGSAGIWERLHYDWSDPDHVVLTTTDSNVWGGASGHTYTFTRQPNGTTDVDVVVVREGKNLKGTNAARRRRDRGYCASLGRLRQDHQGDGSPERRPAPDASVAFLRRSLLRQAGRSRRPSKLDRRSALSQSYSHPTRGNKAEAEGLLPL